MEANSKSQNEQLLYSMMMMMDAHDAKIALANKNQGEDPNKMDLGQQGSKRTLEEAASGVNKENYQSGGIHNNCANPLQAAPLSSLN